MTDSANTGVPRRRFLQTGVGLVTGVLGVSYLGLAGDFLWPPAAGAEPLQQVGTTNQFTEGTPKMVVYKNNGIEEGVYVINQGAKGWLALDFHCTHLNCPVSWSDATNQFVCPCHGGVYDINGHVISGPPPQSLHRRIIQVQGNSVMVGGRLS